MKDLFCSIEIAIELKKLGFDEWCFCFYSDSKKLLYFTGYDVCIYQSLEDMIFTCGEEDLKAPLWEQIITWFEEQYKLVIIIEPYTAEYYTYKIYKLTEIVEIICLYGRDVNLKGDKPRRYSNKYSAKKEAILKAIELITPKQ